MKTEKLIEIITKIIQREVRKETQNLKEQILLEMRQSTQQKPSKNPRLVEMQKDFRTNYKLENTRQNIQYSKNPTLNEILKTTQPVEDSSYLDAFSSEEEIINVPTDLNGRPIAISGNKGMNSVLEAMNRDYSGLVKEMDKGKSESKQQFRQQIISRMEDNNEPDEEDLSWLNEVG